MFVDLANYANLDKVGNKAKSLMHLKNNGFWVPDGFVLDGDVYDEIIKENRLDIKINKLCFDINKENVKEISFSILKLFDEVKIPPNIVSEISKLIKNKKYAVRSSGFKEDLADFAFAGQYSTFLNVEGINDVSSAIIGCYKSMYEERALSYLLDNGMDFKNMKMAVIVQEMIEADLSGIAFSVNPLRGNDKEIVIEVAEGAGEKVVGGKVNPERYIYNWFYEKELYDKNNKLLNREIFLKLSQKVLDIQILYGYPCDIEFAVKGEDIYFLQARPITKILYGDIKEQWTTANFKDGVSASVCTPYMWSLYEYIWEYTLKEFVFDAKILKKSEWRKAGNMFFGRPYWNLSLAKTAMAKVPGYKEREFDNDLGAEPCYEGDGNVTKITPKTLIGILRMAIAQKKIVKKQMDSAGKLKKELLDKYFSYLKVFENEENTHNLEKIWYGLVKNDYLLSQGTYFWQIFINTVNQPIFKKGLRKFVSESEYFNLIGGLDNISHMLPFYEMWQISRKIIENKNSCDFWCNSSVDEIREKYYKNSRENCIPLLADFIKKYGYHSDKELDITYPCYFEDIESVIKTLKKTINMDDKLNPEYKKRKQDEAFKNQMQKLKEKLGKRKYLKYEKAITKMRNMLWWREEFRDISTRFYYIIRLCTIRLAKVYVKEGVINTPEDIWYTKIEDVFNFIDKKITKEDLQGIISRNKKYYQSFRNFLSENEIVGTTKYNSKKAIFSTQDREKAKDNLNKKVKKFHIIRGIGCNDGRATGTARVIKNIEEIDRIQEGDILVTRFTDTGWTAKFAALKGIVTEYGGVLCHTAIVSREYGIPCVVCTKDATKLIKDGSKITIEGSTGEIIKEGG